MKSMPKFWRLALLCLALAACGDDGPGSEALIGGDGGTRNEKDGGIGPDPIVSVLAPSTATDPSSEAVITQRMVDVLCEAKPGKFKSAIDPQMVVVNVYVDDKVVLTQPAVSETISKFKATLLLQDVPAGPIKIECAATDTYDKPLTGKGSIETLLDHGPAITFVSPMDKSAVGSKTDSLVLFKVEPFKLGEQDPGAEVEPSTVSMEINGMAVTPSATAGQANTYEYTIDFGDTKLFPGSLITSATIEVTAQNKRSPAPATASAKLELVVDGEGPTITPVSPLSGQMVGGKVAVEVSVEDTLSGLKPGSVRFEIDNNPAPDKYTLSPGAAPKYLGEFQVGKYLGRSQLTINFIAEDMAGNETRVGFPVDLDSVPPWVSLDPPDVREVYASATPDNPSCSAPFDPVGYESVSDLARLPPAVPARKDRYRALVWERGTAITGDTSVKVSGVKDNSVAIYIQSNPSMPLIVDSDDDPENLCDSVNASTATRLDYTPITPSGTLAKIAVEGSPLFSMPPAIAECTQTPCGAGTCKAQSAPGNALELCNDESDLSLVLQHRIPGKVVPVIYGLNPKSGNLPGCTGELWESPITSGWTCVVGTAVDNVGNVGISMPLRVCYGNDDDCSGPPPSCTDGCVMPEVFSAQGMPRIIYR